MGDRKLNIGDRVIYTDPLQKDHEALVTAVWDEASGAPYGDPPGCNIIYVVDDESRSDQYGRQIERDTSVVHVSYQAAPGRQWRWPDEVRS